MEPKLHKKRLNSNIFHQLFNAFFPMDFQWNFNGFFVEFQWQSWRILGNPSESWRILGNPSESWRSLGNPSESWRTLGNPNESWRILGNPSQS